MGIQSITPSMLNDIISCSATLVIYRYSQKGSDMRNQGNAEINFICNILFHSCLLHCFAQLGKISIQDFATSNALNLH